MQHPHDAVSSSAVPSPLAMERVCSAIPAIFAISDPSQIPPWPAASSLHFPCPPSPLRRTALIVTQALLLHPCEGLLFSSPIPPALKDLLFCICELACSWPRLQWSLSEAELQRLRGSWGEDWASTSSLSREKQRIARDTEPACFSLQDFSPDDAADLLKAGTEASPNQPGSPPGCPGNTRSQSVGCTIKSHRARQSLELCNAARALLPATLPEIGPRCSRATRTAPGQHFSSGDFRHVFRIAYHRPAGSTLSAAVAAEAAA